MKPIKSALISVFDKTGLEPLIQTLLELNITLYSTGGTQKFIESLQGKVTAVEEITGYPSILGGRVKTLHPKIFGGILARRHLPEDQIHLKDHQINEIDLVIVDLYPFEATVNSGAEEAEIIEKIDIGGVSLIRAAAKNFNDVTVIAHKQEYAPLQKLLTHQNGALTLEQRKAFASKAFATTAYYDSTISNYFSRMENIPSKSVFLHNGTPLRYGENPHQQAIFYGNTHLLFETLSGKALSYNNMVDIDAALLLLAEFEKTAFVVIKHTNACGVAVRASVKEAWEAAFAADTISAFGGILATNGVVDEEAAQSIHQIFFEVLIASDFTKAALEILKQKKNRILLKQKAEIAPKTQIKSLLNGYIMQDADLQSEKEVDLKPVTQVKPEAHEIEDLLFASRCAKHLKSNTIVLAKNKQLLGMGCGQTSRVDALKQAIHKAKIFGFDLKNAVMASDAFFPFPDCVEIAHHEGIRAVIQPGGSIKDQESIDYCNANHMSMVLTGFRHFKH